MMLHLYVCLKTAPIFSRQLQKNMYLTATVQDNILLKYVEYCSLQNHHVEYVFTILKLVKFPVNDAYIMYSLRTLL